MGVNFILLVSCKIVKGNRNKREREKADRSKTKDYKDPYMSCNCMRKTLQRRYNRLPNIHCKLLRGGSTMSLEQNSEKEPVYQIYHKT